MRKKALVCLLTAVLCFSMTACGESGGNETTTNDATTETSDNTETSDTAEETTDASGEETDDYDMEDLASDLMATSEPFTMDGAKEETWGALTVSVPNGWEFRKGDTFDEKDERYCSVKKSDFVYFDFKMEDEETIKQNYDYNKKTYTNEQTDVGGKIGDIEWEGFQYGDGFGGYGVEIFAKSSKKPIRLSIAGFAFDSPETKAILESLKIK